MCTDIAAPILFKQVVEEIKEGGCVHCQTSLPPVENVRPNGTSGPSRSTFPYFDMINNSLGHEYTQVHVNINISGIFFFISHLNNLEEILSFWNKDKSQNILCM